MPTYPNQITLGEGKFRARVVAEGWPEIWVSDASLVRSLADGRSQILGLDASTLRIAASVDLARGKLMSSEQTFEIVDDSEVGPGYVQSSGSVVASLSKAPTVTTSLTADLTAVGTSITVASTAGLSADDFIHIGTEAIKIGAVPDTTSLTGCTRAQWGTVAQAHFTGDGDRLAYPRVTNRPRTLRGRRILVYLYGNADSDTSDGTLRWRGVCRTDVAYQQGRWSFGVEPATWILEQPIGGDLEEPVPIQGITLPSTSGIGFVMSRRGGSARTDALSADVDARVNLSGHWDDNEEFIDALNTKIATAVSGWSWDADAQIVAVSNGPGGWRLVYSVGSTTAHWVDILVPIGPGRLQGLSPVDPVYDVDGAIASWHRTSDGVPLDDLSSGIQYEIQVGGQVPRAVFGEFEGPREGTNHYLWVDVAGTQPMNRLYIGGTVVPTVNMLAAILPTGSGDGDFSPATAVSTSERYLDLEARPAMLLGPRSAVNLGRTILLADNLQGLIAQLVADSPGTVNAGAMPLVRYGSSTTFGDFDSTFGDLAEAERGNRAAIRSWVTTEGIELGEILEHEHRLRAVYPALDSTGLITWKRLRPPLKTDIEAFTLTASTLVDAWPAVSRNPDGHLREVLFRQGWNPIENEHLGLTIRVRDVQGADPTPSGGVLEIAPRSFGRLRGDFGLEIDPEDAQTMGQVVLGMFSGAYRTITLEAYLGHFNLVLGDVGILTSTLIPDSDGTFGLTSKECTLIGYDWSPLEGKGTLTLLLTELNIGGYCPEFLIASEVDNGSDNWTLTLTLAGYTTETDVSKWVAVGDEVRVIERNVASPTRLSGTVTSVPDLTQIAVTFDSTWTVGSNDWFVGWDTTAAVDETAPAGRRWAQSDFAKIGGTDGLAALGSGDTTAEDLSP